MLLGHEFKINRCALRIKVVSTTSAVLLTVAAGAKGDAKQSKFCVHFSLPL